jgi:hypothetical protein
MSDAPNPLVSTQYKVRQAVLDIASGTSVVEACRRHGISEETYRRNSAEVWGLIIRMSEDSLAEVAGQIYTGMGGVIGNMIEIASGNTNASYASQVNAANTVLGVWETLSTRLPQGTSTVAKSYLENSAKEDEPLTGPGDGNVGSAV